MMNLLISTMISANLLMTPITVNTQPKEIKTYDVKQEIKPISKAVVNSYKYRQKVNIIATAYTNSVRDTGKTDGITKSGVRASRGTLAVPNDIPFFTRIDIEGLGQFVAHDRGGAIKRLDDHTIIVDVFLPNATDYEVKKFGRQHREGYIYKSENIFKEKSENE